MNKTYLIYAHICFVLILTSCGSLERETERMQRQLLVEMSSAMLQTQELKQQLNTSFDSIWALTEQRNEKSATMFFVFDSDHIIYWSENWLAAHEVVLLKYDEWYYQRFDNAHCVCRWTKAMPYNILTVIPIQYAYTVENKQLNNTFLAPFCMPNNSEVTLLRNQDYPIIYDDTGRFLFSIQLIEKSVTKNINTDRLADTFSYQALLATNESDAHKTFFGNHVRLFFILSILLFVTIIVLGIIGLIRSRGFSNMRLQTKFMYGIITLILINAIYVFTMSAVQVMRDYEDQQRHVLQRKTRYLQKALQDNYFWNMSLGIESRAGMNVDLRDLSFAYEMDIHVYDLKGKLVGSSTPELFERGLLSERMATEPFFTLSKSTTYHEPILREEHIGDMSYLAAYTEFFNGNYMPIGYISVPMFISSDEISAEADAFLAKLLPPTLLLLILSLIISILMARGFTQPLYSLAEKMQLFRIGTGDNRVVYSGNDEIGQLVVRYNELVEELERSAEQLANSEREGAWRTMARQIAHEINNSLTPMKLTIQQLQRSKIMADSRFDNYFDHSTKLLIQQIDNLSYIAQSFSSFAKMPEVVITEVDIAQKLCNVVELLKTMTNASIRYVGVKDNVIVLTDEEQISNVLINLLKNAIQAVEHNKSGDIIVILKRLNKWIEISISDNGPGIAPDVQDKIFRPNFTTKSTGMGLGLAIAKNIIEESKGTITFNTSPQGTTFIVHLRSI